MRTKFVDNYAVVKSVKDDGVLSAVVSTGAVDRDGEIVLPSAFLRHLDRYRKNPVILAAHTHRSADGSPTIIGSAVRIEVRDDALEFDMTFASTEVGREWKKLFDEGHARAFSVGFIPRDGSFDKARNAFVWTEVELLEISAVAVPANPEALARRGLDAGDPPKPAETAASREVLACELETLGQRLARTEKEGDNFREVAQAVRAGEISEYEARALLQKVRRDIQRRSEHDERRVNEAIDQLLKIAGGEDRRLTGPDRPCSCAGSGREPRSGRG